MNPAHRPVPGAGEPATVSHRGRGRAEALGVCPCLTYCDVRRAITWLQTAFGIHGQALAPPGTAEDQSLEHAMLHTPMAAGRSWSSPNAPTNCTVRTPGGDGST